jgi:DNA-binding CsgD family transcriptional regulator
MRKLPANGVQLSPREAQIVRAVSRGASNKAIADELQIGSRTIANYLYRLFWELRVPNRAALGRWALENPGAMRGEIAARGLHPANCECGSPYCTEMRRHTGGSATG